MGAAKKEKKRAHPGAPDSSPQRQRFSAEEQNVRLRERLRRREFDLAYERAQKNELIEENQALHQSIHQAQRENDELKQENERLKAILRPAWVKENKKLPAPGVGPGAKRKPGAQPGHPAHQRRLPPRIDAHVNLTPDRCPSCEGKLGQPTQWHTHTQTDLPREMRAITTQYHVGWSYCRHCKQMVSIAEKLDRSKYGPRLHARVGYWKFGLGMTYPKIQTLLKEEYDLEIGTGELAELAQSDSARLFRSVDEGIKPRLKEERLVSADETGWRKSGKNCWLWSFSSDRLSYYTIEKGRSKAVVRDVLGEKFDGILSSDFLGSYSFIQCRKQKCWVHLLRELKEDREKYPGNEEVLRFSAGIRRFYDRGVALARRKQKRKSYQKQLRRLISDTDRFAARKWKHPEMGTLAQRLKWHREALYTFVPTGIPPHNNAAEREIRPAVLMRKTSYCNRSDRGALTQTTWMSLIRTCQKQGKSFLKSAEQFLVSA